MSKLYIYLHSVVKLDFPTVSFFFFYFLPLPPSYRLTHHRHHHHHPQQVHLDKLLERTVKRRAERLDVLVKVNRELGTLGNALGCEFEFLVCPR